jgi:hypothetical protein
MTRAKSILFLFALALSVASTRAILTFILTPPTQSGVGTNEVFFIGTLTNTSATDNLFLNNIQFAFTNAATNYLTADTNVFFANVPGILLPGETYSDVIFGIAVNSATPPGNYFGTATVQGGTNIFDATNLSGQTFQISLPPATLQISNSGTNLILSWPTLPGGFVLQQNSNLAATNWTATTNAPAIANFQDQIIFPSTNGNQFFRLKYP